MRASQIEAYAGRRAIRAALAAGAVVGIGGGAYALPEADRRTSTAFRSRGVLCNRSAAAHWGFALLPGPEAFHVSIPRRARRVPDPGVILHYRPLCGADLAAGVTSPVATVLDCLRDLSFAEALAVGDSALRSGLVHADELVDVAGALRGPGSRRVRDRVRWLDARAENAFESCCRAILIEGGISSFTPQLSIRHDGRFLGRVDLGNRALRIVLECESFAHHGDRAALRRDCRRYTDLEAAGWRVIRVSWEHVMFDRPWVLSRVREVVAVAS
jgi:very-short-patch-repair endonuclease